MCGFNALIALLFYFFSACHKLACKGAMANSAKSHTHEHLGTEAQFAEIPCAHVSAIYVAPQISS
jgi:hypothetical protein